MGWRGNSAVVVYNDGKEVRSMKVEGAFGDLGVRFLQAIPSELGAMPVRLTVHRPYENPVTIAVLTDVTDIQALGESLRLLADKVYDLVKCGSGFLVEFRNGSGTRRMEITGITDETNGVVPDESEDPVTNGIAVGMTDEAGLRSEF